MEFVDAEIPQRFIVGCDGDIKEARRRWSETLKWRLEERVDDILMEEQPFFHHIKHYYPHGVHRQAKNGNYVYIERPPKADLDHLFQGPVEMDHLLRHYVFITEFIWKVLDQREDEGRLVTIMDVEGVGMFDLVGTALEFLTKASAIVQAHYVERQSKIFVINAPPWFELLWIVVSPFMSTNTLQKVEILGEEYRDKLLELVDEESLPSFLGGSDVCEFMSSPEEEALALHVDRLTRGEDPFEEEEEDPDEELS